MSDSSIPPPSNPPTRKRGLGVKPTSRNVGQTRIRELKCYQEVYDRIVEGWSAVEVAKFIQEVKKEAIDLTPAGLTSAISEFRKKLPPAVLTSRKVTPVFMKAKKEVEEGLDELAELSRLYKLQMGRIEIDLKTEKKINKLMPSMVQEVRIAKEILTTIADLKMDLGLSKRHIGEMQVETKILADVAVRYQKPEVREVMANPQARKKLLDLAERLLAARLPPLPEGESRVAVPQIIEMEAQPASDEELEGLSDLEEP